MSPQNILWGLAGFVAFLIFQLVRPVRNRSGWDFVVQVAFFAATSFLVAKIFITAVRALFPAQAAAATTLWRDNLSSVPGLLALGILAAAPVTGIALGWLWHRCHPYVSWLAKKLGGRERNFEFPDTFFKMTHELLGEMTLISTKSGKVYVGVLNEVTSDPNEPARYVRISPIMSGYRRKEDFKVVFNTNYVVELQKAATEKVEETIKNVPNRDLLMPVSEITTLAHFDPGLHETFVKAGITVVSGSNPESDKTVEPMPPETTG